MNWETWEWISLGSYRGAAKDLGETSSVVVAVNWGLLRVMKCRNKDGGDLVNSFILYLEKLGCVNLTHSLCPLMDPRIGRLCLQRETCHSF